MNNEKKDSIKILLIFRKIFLAVTGATSIVFDMVTPILLVIFLISHGTFSSYNTNMIIIGGIMATLYRGTKTLLMEA